MLFLRTMMCGAVLLAPTIALAAELPIPNGPHHQVSQPPKPDGKGPQRTPNNQGDGRPVLNCPDGTYPNVKPGTTVTITQADAHLTMPVLCIPDGVTLKVAPDVSAVEWTVGKMIFGVNVTIDLASGAAKAARGGDGGPPPGQAGYCTLGQGGAGGGGGSTGASGVSLTIKDLESISDQGSLWIRTDGAVGGDGGNGGQGQQGGGHRKSGIGGHCNARDGGPGGSGGPGGPGGATSPIKLTLRADQHDLPHNPLIAGCATTCTPSARPPSATGNTGVIAVWGAPGCGGNGGSGGPGGLEGDRGESIPGGNGGAGGAGPLGACSPATGWGGPVKMMRSAKALKVN